MKEKEKKESEKRKYNFLRGETLMKERSIPQVCGQMERGVLLSLGPLDSCFTNLTSKSKVQGGSQLTRVNSQNLERILEE